jgi:hypothetical protein
MDNYRLIQQLKTEIAESEDARIESKLVLAKNKTLSPDDFLIACNCSFYREFSKDVFSSEIKEDARKKNILHLNLTRRGIYDQLPEGIFYQPAKTKAYKTTAAEMAAEYKVNKEVEQGVRRFFMPFENDFFLQRMQSEEEEIKLLEGLQSGILNDYFINFWDISSSIPKSLIIHLITLLPHAHQIAGDIILMAECLQLMLREEVKVKKIYAPLTSSDHHFELGSQLTGTDFVCGMHFNEDYPVIEFTIGPLENSQISDYLQSGNREKFLTTFFRFFLPAEADVITKIKAGAEKENLVLQAEEPPILGYSSVL